MTANDATRHAPYENMKSHHALTGATLYQQFAQAADLEATIRQNLEALGYEE